MLNHFGVYWANLEEGRKSEVDRSRPIDRYTHAATAVPHCVVLIDTI